MNQMIDEIIGKRFGILTAVNRLKNSKIECACDCGNSRIVFSGHLNTGKIKSCGCHARRHGHGKSGNRSREYISYYNMIARCTKPSNKRFKDYGAKGITVCDRWIESFVNFLTDMGECPDQMQIDRRDNRLGYFPENCQWVTPKKNMANRFVSVIYTIDGIDYESSLDAAKTHAVSAHTILAWCKGRKVGQTFYPPKVNCSFRSAHD